MALPFVAALILVGHLLGPHPAAFAPSPVASHGHHAPHEPGEPPGHHGSGGEDHCGYLCPRGGDDGTAGSATGWAEAVPVPGAPGLPIVAARANGARAPPDLVRELQVMRV
ncbi:hypothetical protein B0I33_102495 [Prauserella shujinwangii]|uniref:Secreted protein n=1 Tax=Prauserella shujinwangii TaxID=1453103 RepID=A0A2T0M1A1_9PSEU|nr:hypothetical protein [Prauserella shujinwangii]PRX50374.1 hypothetical protein B0I33_102495 [Prauserella shujinwangii]